MTKLPKNNKCIDCGSVVIDEFPNVDYLGCDGCPRIYEREKDRIYKKVR